jgi:uncharacterized membrane-anchored protein
MVMVVVGAVPAGAESKRKQQKAPVEEPAPAPEPPPDPLADIVHVKGPQLVSLHEEIEIDLPAGAFLLEKAAAVELVRKGGGSTDEIIGALVHPDKNWLILIEYAPVGHVTDSDANQLDQGSMLEDYKRSTIAQNKHRVSMGVPELFVDSWSETPRYDAAQRMLVWGLNAHSNEGPIINFFTRILGRGGFISVNLIDEPAAIEASKAETAALRSAIRFKQGFRYEDFREGDKSSGMGLKALILGGSAVAAKKAGLLAGLLIVLKKFGVFVVLGIGALGRWLFKRKQTPPSDPTPTT